jgi:hypothetical protein
MPSRVANCFWRELRVGASTVVGTTTVEVVLLHACWIRLVIADLDNLVEDDGLSLASAL